MKRWAILFLPVKISLWKVEDVSEDQCESLLRGHLSQGTAILLHLEPIHIINQYIYKYNIIIITIPIETPRENTKERDSELAL